MSFTLLISSVGRRSQLIECFRTTQASVGQHLRVIGSDASPELAPAAYLADATVQVPRCSSPEFISAMLELCRRERVGLVLPTIDPELPVYAAHRQAFQEMGTVVAVSAPETVRIASDKFETNRWLRAHNFPTVVQAPPDEVLANPSHWRFPIILKPRQGSASIGVQRVFSLAQLEVASRGVPGLVAEELATGEEHTVNVYVDRRGKCLCAVPHRRIETRSGEVSKAATRKHPRLMELASDIAEALPGAWGALNIQCFLDDDGTIRVTEINARFGGGYPLAHHAGANFPLWLVNEAMGMQVDAKLDAWQDGLLMLRHDTAVFVMPGQQAPCCSFRG